MLNTLISITLYTENDAEQLFKEVFQECQRYENLFSVNIENSDVWRINNSGGSPVEVAEETLELIQYAKEYSELSQGVFDITVKPLSDLWDYNNPNPKIPQRDEIQDALKSVGYQNIEIQGNKIIVRNNAKLELGGIAKGYIADKLVELLKNKGIKHGLINLGGNIAVIGTKPDGSPWKLGIQKPFGTNSEIMDVLELTKGSLVTSGVYQRNFIIDNKIYHHIIDPFTGYPTDNGLYSVTILSDDSFRCDALSTVCLILGLEKGMELVESLAETEAVFVTDTYEVFKSSGLK